MPELNKEEKFLWMLAMAAGFFFLAAILMQLWHLRLY